MGAQRGTLCGDGGGEGSERGGALEFRHFGPDSSKTADVHSPSEGTYHLCHTLGQSSPCSGQSYSGPYPPPPPPLARLTITIPTWGLHFCIKSATQSGVSSGTS